MDRLGLIRALGALDLGEREATVYVDLLKSGPSNAGPIIRRSGLHRQLIYSALGRLEQSGLCTVTSRNGRKVFQAASPRQLIELQRKRESAALSLIPDLERLQANALDALEVTTSRGIPEFRRNLILTLEEAAMGDKVLRVIGGGDSETFYNTLGDFYHEYHSTGQRLGITKRLIASANRSTKFLERFALEKATELRLSDTLSSPTYTRITPTLVTIEVYGTDPIVIQIRNRGVALSYREHFEALWPRCQRLGSN